MDRQHPGRAALRAACRSPQQRGGRRSGKAGPKGLTRDQLYNEDRQRNIHGRSRISKSELAEALGKK
ncbi:hypothetical protein ACIP5Y_18670 [Nocardia sp. NPDC088792]|uniref:hypothetical protein n=1 Tax=Nocardia sp. NPDC088792 TaxID=3364332 RepID=UPI0038204492